MGDQSYIEVKFPNCRLEDKNLAKERGMSENEGQLAYSRHLSVSFC